VIEVLVNLRYRAWTAPRTAIFFSGKIVGKSEMGFWDPRDV
jgi:hypothetical protein